MSFPTKRDIRIDHHHNPSLLCATVSVSVSACASLVESEQLALSLAIYLADGGIIG